VAGIRGAEHHVTIDVEWPLKSLSVCKSPDEWETHLVKVGEKSYQLVIVPFRDRPGEFKESICLDGVDQEGKPLPRYRLIAEGYAAPMVRAYPQVVDLGIVRSGERQSCVMYIASARGQITAVESSDAGPEVVLQLSCRQADGRWRFEATITPERASYGVVNGRLRVQLDGGNWHDVAYRISWYRVAD